MCCCGRHRRTVISLERGRYDPGLPLAFGIARLFDRAIEELFHDGIGPPPWDRASPRTRSDASSITS
jgi:DNA-binding XRE family transcriptional regulator